MATSFIDGGPVTVTAFDAPTMATQVVTGPPITITLDPGSLMALGGFQRRAAPDLSFGSGPAPVGRKRRGSRKKQHLAEHLRSAAGEY